MYKSFAEKFGGKVVSIDWCKRTNVHGQEEVLPSCEGHATIVVPEENFYAAEEAAIEFTHKSGGFASIEII